MKNRYFFSLNERIVLVQYENKVKPMINQA